MKKILLVVLLLILVVLVGGPYAMGFMVEKTYKQLLTQAPKDSRMQVSLVSYDRGWFSSQAKLAVTLRLPKALGKGQNQAQELQGIKFDVLENIEHGPVLYGVNIDGKRRIAFGQAYMMASAESNTINGYAMTLVKFNGRIRNQINLQQLNYNDKQLGVLYAIKNVNTKTVIAPGFKKMAGHIKIGSVDLVTPNVQQQTDNLVTQFQLYKAAEGFYLGDTNTTIKQQAGLFLKSIQFKLGGVKVQTASGLADDKVNYLMDITADDLMVSGKQYGPFALKLDAKNLDLTGLAKLRDELQQLESQTAAPTKSQMKDYLSTMMQLAGKGLDINIEKLDLTVPEGQVQATAHMVVNPIAGQVNNPLMLLANLSINLGVQMPKALVQQLTEAWIDSERAHFAAKQPEATSKSTSDKANSSAKESTKTPVVKPQMTVAEQASKQIKQWLDQSVLVATGDDYQLNISFKQMQLLINGKTLDGNPKSLLPQAG